MSRKCSTCQHVKRAEIDRRLAGGEPGKQVASDYDLNPSSLHRHRVNCLKLVSSNAIMKEVARGTAAVACLPSRDDLGSAYSDLRAQLDEIVGKAVDEGQPKTAITGLNSMRQTLDSLMRLAGHDRPTAQTNVAVKAGVSLDLDGLAERLIKKFDHDPELKGRIAEAIFDIADDAEPESVVDNTLTETDDE